MPRRWRCPYAVSRSWRRVPASARDRDPVPQWRSPTASGYRISCRSDVLRTGRHASYTVSVRAGRSVCREGWSPVSGYGIRPCGRGSRARYAGGSGRRYCRWRAGSGYRISYWSDGCGLVLGTSYTVSDGRSGVWRTHRRCPYAVSGRAGGVRRRICGRGSGRRYDRCANDIRISYLVADHVGARASPFVGIPYTVSAPGVRQGLAGDGIPYPVSRPRWRSRPGGLRPASAVGWVSGHQAIGRWYPDAVSRTACRGHMGSIRIRYLGVAARVSRGGAAGV
jgi:hypothetical protein